MELALVLVILGLLIGSILTGQSLIRASERHEFTTQITKISTSIYAFRDKYMALPGDFTMAANAWGTDPNGCPTNTVRTARTATCNGDGDGKIAGTNMYESFRAWQHLANAGLIEGSYSGVEGPITANFDHDPGINTPALKLGTSTGITFYAVTPVSTAGTYQFVGPYGNTLAIGSCNNWDCIDPDFLPEDSWNIDNKIDDGKPGSGKLITRASGPGAGAHTNCNTATAGGGNGVESTAEYNVLYTAPACAFYYVGGF